ncbi:SMI1/KNR4 family protein [Kitasatospora sp. NPDC052896]|uniref:SMI1/KNR4 family protein n=1 Tax=Kitasatospora sp. NPDC052896 TaxID=3364061 RepID=UPI0037C4F4D4
MDDQLWVGVRERVEALAGVPTQAGRHPVFGPGGHGFRLDPVLSPAAVVEVEARIGVELPQEYRTFLLQVGAGGAGPAYGLYPAQLKPGYPLWSGHNADTADYSRLAEAFPATPLDPTALRTLLARCPPEEDDRDPDYLAFLDRWNEVMWGPHRTVGAIPLCSLGDGREQWLVLSGPERGRIWNDDRADHGDLTPAPDGSGGTVTFARWYLDWLDSTEQRLSSVRDQVPDF